jgi:citrate synthase
MGVMTFPDVAFLLATGRKPDDNESKLFNAILVSLADHGLTPIALAARLTYTGAPEALQGAVAAGLLGGGSVFLGPVEDTASFLHAIVRGSDDPGDDATLRAGADGAVNRAVARGERIPGLGHPIHRTTDPRTARLYEIARECGLVGPHLRLLEHVAESHRSATGRSLPINGAGAAGAVLVDMGFPPELTRGFALLARTAGLVAHLAEEMTDPIGMKLWREVEGLAPDPKGE